MAESYAGITVPEGEPDTIRDAASTFHGVAGGLHGASSDLRSVPGLVSDWKGPASAAFGGTVVTNGSCVDDAAAAMGTCATAARTYADDLEAAQKAARQAIADARDAQDRIDKARADLEAAAGAETDASNRMQSAGARLSSGVPDPSASADYDAASGDYTAAQNAASDAKRRLEQAEADLEAAQRRGHAAEKAAKDAARAAAGAFDGVAGHSPAAAMFGGSPTGIENDVLARVRAGDYSVLDTIPFNYLPKDTQRKIAAEIAKESYKASYGEGSHTMEQMAGVVRHFEHDDEFATGFYNQLGGNGARNLADDIIMFHSTGHGLEDPSLVALMAPFATLLGTATRSKDLRSDFTDDFIGDAPIKDRIPGHLHLAAFIMAGSATNYSSPFLSRVGKEILVDSQNTADGAPPFVELSDYQDFMKFVAGNHEASGMLLAGHWGPEGHFSNVVPLLQYGPRYTDGGDALGALIQAGTHDLRMDGDIPLSNDAAHAVIQGVPAWHEGIPDGAKPALVQILDDHIEDFDYAAIQKATPGLFPAPGDHMSGFDYQQGHDYLKTLVGWDETRHDATRIVGERVAYDIDQSVVQNNPNLAQRGGSLSEMGVLATADADLDAAKLQDTLHGFEKTAADKLVSFVPGKKFLGPIAGQAFDQIFSTDNVQHALEQNGVAQIDAMGQVKRLSIASQVAHGKLPEEALQIVDPNGNVNSNFVQGPLYDHDVVKIDTNGDGVPDHNLEWDLDGDGKPETTITERDLYQAGLGPAEASHDGMVKLHNNVYDSTHAPDIDDLPLPDDIHHDDEGFLGKAWPFGDNGSGSINDGSHTVAHQDDLTWDDSEGVYRLPVDGGSELHYMRVGEDWKLVEKVDGVWQVVK
jgi:uncharacterized protein YukE